MNETLFALKKILAEPDDLLKGVTCCLPLSQSPALFSSSAFSFFSKLFPSCKLQNITPWTQSCICSN